MGCTAKSRAALTKSVRAKNNSLRVIPRPPRARVARSEAGEDSKRGQTPSPEVAAVEASGLVFRPAALVCRFDLICPCLDPTEVLLGFRPTGSHGMNSVLRSRTWAAAKTATIGGPWSGGRSGRRDLPQAADSQPEPGPLCGAGKTIDIRGGYGAGIFLFSPGGLHVGRITDGRRWHDFPGMDNADVERAAITAELSLFIGAIFGGPLTSTENPPSDSFKSNAGKTVEPILTSQRRRWAGVATREDFR